MEEKKVDNSEMKRLESEIDKGVTKRQALNIVCGGESAAGGKKDGGK